MLLTLQAHDVVGAKTASAAAQYISPFANYTSQEALCKSGNNTAVGKDFRTESLNSRGSVSTESHTSTKSLHCPSGRHPLDFACIGEVEGANVDKDNILVCLGMVLA